MSNTKKEFMVEYFKKIMYNKGADMVTKIITRDLTISYVILYGSCHSKGLYYSGIFPFSDSEFFTVNSHPETNTKMIGSEESTSNSRFLNNIMEYNSLQQFVNERHELDSIYKIEEQLSVVYKMHTGSLVGFGHGNFKVVDPTIHVQPLRCICVKYMYNGVLDGFLTLLISKDNYIKNPFRGNKAKEFMYFVDSFVEVLKINPVKWEEEDDGHILIFDV